MIVVSASGCCAFEVADQRVEEVVTEGQVGQLGNKLRVGDGVECFREIYCHECSTEGRARLIET